MPYPIFVKLAGCRCVVVGAGRVAERRIDGLLHQNAIVRVVAPQATSIITSLADTGSITWVRAPYADKYLDSAVLVVAATDDPVINEAVTRDASARNTLVCRADKPDDGSFITPTSVQRGELTIALSTGGSSPTLSSVLKTRLENQFGPEWAAWTQLFASLRPQIQMVKSEVLRKTLVERILEDSEVGGYIAAFNLQAAEKEAVRCISSSPA